MLTTPPEGLRDDVSRFFGPHERGRMSVPLREVALDVPDEGPDSLERAPTDRLTREDTEPRLDQVQPRRALGGEVKMHLASPARPARRGCHAWRSCRG